MRSRTRRKQATGSMPSRADAGNGTVLEFGHFGDGWNWFFARVFRNMSSQNIRQMGSHGQALPGKAPRPARVPSRATLTAALPATKATQRPGKDLGPAKTWA